MTNAIINESISFESTLGSPSKPRPSIIIQKPKPIFLVRNVEDCKSTASTQYNSGSNQKRKKPRRKRSKSTKNELQKINSLNNNTNSGIHMLDFDALFNDIIMNEKKSLDKSLHTMVSNITSKNSKDKKTLGFKRIRLFQKNPLNKSKYSNIIVKLFLIRYYYRK